MNPQNSNPNDFKVVSFHNKEEFGFIPEMGCMYDGRPINGKNGSPGIDAGETIILPYHIAHRLATNLAKITLLKSAPSVDPAGIPTGVPLWDTVRLDALRDSYLTDLYSENKPVAQSETEKLLAKVEELRAWKESVEAKDKSSEPTESIIEPIVDTNEDIKETPKRVFLDKAEVLAELEKRGIKHDKRKNKDDLEKLLA